ncbi:MAG: hypothetical protein HOG51_00840 [Gammaproteobacteria bacterium]|nr:hypothetical protein [Gammaproteobacteria bacterium]
MDSVAVRKWTLVVFVTPFMTADAKNLPRELSYTAYFTRENIRYPRSLAGDGLTVLRLLGRLTARVQLTWSYEPPIVTHEIKLEKSVKVILLVFGIAMFAHTFQFTNLIEDALAETLNGGVHVEHSGRLSIFDS